MDRSAQIFIALLLFLTAAAEHLIQIPLSHRPVPAARAFSLVRRPWASKLSSRTSVPHKLNSAHLTTPIRVAVNSSIHQLPEEAMYGDIVKLGEYYVTLTFGGQPINVQVDTGSSTIAVPLKECKNCRPNDHRLDLRKAKGTAGYIGCESDVCRKNSCGAYSACVVCSRHRRACCAAVAPDACGFYLLYADKSGASGALVQADVGIAGMSVPLIFGAILRETSEFENDNVDGIFGMAYKSLACNPTCVAPLFDTLVQTGKVKRDIFSLCTARNGGTLTLGGSNPHFYEGELEYVPQISTSKPHFYDVAVKKVTVGGHKVDVPDFGDAIVDSGTTVLVLAPKSYMALKAHFQENYCHVPGLCTRASGRQLKDAEIVEGPADLLGSGANRPEASEWKTKIQENTWFSPGYCVNLKEHEVKMLPDITIGLENGVKLVLDPDTYMLQYEAKSAFPLERVIYRCLGITFLEGLQHMENNAILGNTALHKYFVEYDRENKRIGFAVAKNCLDSESRMTGPGAVLNNAASSALPRWIIDGLIFAAVIGGVCLVTICIRESRKYTQYTPIPESS